MPSHTGSWHLVLGSATSDATITQTLATVPGQSYTFNFWFWSSGGDPTRDFHALWNGTEVYAEINSDAHDYEKHTFTVTATGTSTTIEFLSRNDPAWDGLDDVSVVPIGSIPVGFTITSPAVIATNPEGGPVTAPFNQVRVTFDRPMDPTTVAPANITLTGPGGAIPVTITAVEGTNNTQFDVTFADQNDVGTYTLAISTGVHDSFDNPVTPFARQFVLGELVTNGGFEDPLGPEWTIVDPSGYTARTPDHPHTGNYALQLGAIGADATITQTLATAPGQSYTFSFWYDRDGLTPSDLHVFWNGVDAYDEVNSAPHDYVQHTFTVMATGTSTQIQFRARNDPGYDYLDDVSVIAN